MTSRQLLQQALEALEYAAEHVYSETNDDVIGAAITTLRAKVEELTRQAEPGYWRKCHDIAEATNVALRKQVEELTQQLQTATNAALSLDEKLASMTQNCFEAEVAELKETLTIRVNQLANVTLRMRELEAKWGIK